MDADLSLVPRTLKTQVFARPEIVHAVNDSLVVDRTSVADETVIRRVHRDVVLGVDPGTHVTGYGWVKRSRGAPSGLRVVGYGRIVASTSAAPSVRLGEIMLGLERLFAEFHPGLVVVERAFVGKNMQTAIRLGEARGLALAIAGRLGIEVLEMPPALAKNALTGNPHATKDQVALMVKRVLGISLEGVARDSTDALSLAIAGARRRNQ